MKRLIHRIISEITRRNHKRGSFLPPMWQQQLINSRKVANGS